MPRDVPQLTYEDIDEIAEVLGAWGRAHPRRDEPLIRLADGSELTPADIARAASEPESPIGRLLYRVIAYGTVEDEYERGRSIHEILTPYRRDLEEWRGVHA